LRVVSAGTVGGLGRGACGHRVAKSKEFSMIMLIRQLISC
jgi:hypothetical protein